MNRLFLTAFFLVLQPRPGGRSERRQRGSSRGRADVGARRRSGAPTRELQPDGCSRRTVRGGPRPRGVLQSTFTAGASSPCRRSKRVGKALKGPGTRLAFARGLSISGRVRRLPEKLLDVDPPQVRGRFRQAVHQTRSVREPVEAADVTLARETGRRPAAGVHDVQLALGRRAGEKRHAGTVRRPPGAGLVLGRGGQTGAVPAARGDDADVEPDAVVSLVGRCGCRQARSPCGRCSRRG